MTRERPTTIAILGGNTVAGLALSLLLRSVGYETIILKAPPTGPVEDVLGGANLLLVSPGLGEGRREENLAALRGVEEELRIPVLAFNSAVEEGLFCDQAVGASWPVEIDVLARAIEAALGGEAQTKPDIVANPMGREATLP